MRRVFCVFYRALLRKSKWRRKGGMGKSFVDFILHSEVILRNTCT
jgi:hypothetical protein